MPISCTVPDSAAISTKSPDLKGLVYSRVKPPITLVRADCTAREIAKVSTLASAITLDTSMLS